jgi:hypothetical protein
MIGELLPEGWDTTVAGISRQGAVLTLFAVVVLTAGCSGFVGGDESADDSAPLDSIPEEADGLVHVKAAIVSDSATESVMDGLAEMETMEGEAVDSPDSWDDILTEFENETDIDNEDLHSMTTFGGNGTGDSVQDYSGVIIKSDLSWDEFKAVAEEDVEAENITEDSYNGVTIYTAEREHADGESWVADFGDGTFAMGPESVVKDVIDTREGDAPGMDDDLQSYYEDATDGYIRGAFTLTDKQASTAGNIAAEEAGVGQMFVPQAEAVTMSYHTEDDQINMEMDMVLQSAEDAESFTGFVEPIVEPPSGEENPDPKESPFAWSVSQFTIDSEGERVTMSFKAGPDKLVTALESLSQASLFGTGPAVSDFAIQPSVTTAD